MVTLTFEDMEDGSVRLGVAGLPEDESAEKWTNAELLAAAAVEYAQQQGSNFSEVLDGDN